MLIATLFFIIIVLRICIFIDDEYIFYFPLSTVCDDNANYTLVKYGPDAYYILDDDEYIKKHKHSVFIIYPTWLENSTGDGYFYLLKDGDTVFSCDFLNGYYFDFFISNQYTKFETLEELILFEKSLLPK